MPAPTYRANVTESQIMSRRLTANGDELRAKFFELKSRGDVANLLEVDENRLIYHLYIVPLDQQYKSFSISKRSGKERLINAPGSSLKLIQQKLNQVLQYVYSTKPSVHGFIQNKSVLTNARVHLRRKNILNIDLKDFFRSINFGRVRGLFMSKPYNLPPKVATILAQICCYKNELPQGAPTSPTISNMICGKLDDQLQHLAKKSRCIYTRYADDITFSTHLSKFSKNIVDVSAENGDIEIGNELHQIIVTNGFSINLNKVSVQSRFRRQQVTGITVNKVLNVRQRYRNQIRAMLHAWQKYGLESAQQEFREKYDEKSRVPLNTSVSFTDVVKGKIDYLGMVRGKDDSTYLRYYAQFCLLAGINNTRQVVAKPTPRKVVVPRVLTEGKTDWKHLKIALNKLHQLGVHTDLAIELHEYNDEMPAGNDALKDMCMKYCHVRQDLMHIFMFDSDDAAIIKHVTEQDKQYKSWGNNVFSFVIPTPTHRQATPDISIELYYKDTEITRLDTTGRRLFLNSEFRSINGRHKTDNLTCMDRKKINNQKRLIVIDSQVYDDNENDVSLSKNSFAEYILHQEDNFNDFDYTSFAQIFDIIKLIIHENS